MENRKSWFWRELDEGYIHFRDHLQFELKSEFKTEGKEGSQTFLQELYLCVPESLQINRNTYSREQFYLDEMNIIRYKTPSFSFENFLRSPSSPLYKLKKMIEVRSVDEPPEAILFELKMLGNIYRSTLRQNVKKIVDQLEHQTDKEISEAMKGELHLLCNHVVRSIEAFQHVKENLLVKESNPLILKSISQIEEFYRGMTENYLTGLLDYLRARAFHGCEAIDQEMADIIVKEGLVTRTTCKEEEILLRSSQIIKSLYDALSLKNVRVETKSKHGAWIGMIAAGAAMLVYMCLFVWKATTFGITSVPFVLFAVIFYILKDRIKEGMKELYNKNAYRWFPDYSTAIETNDEKPIGKLNESFQFVDEIPDEFKEFRKDVEGSFFVEGGVKENIMQYKKEIILTTNEAVELNTLFRFNIHKFVEKAGDSLQPRLKIDPESKEIFEYQLPKVYYLTVLLKNTFKGKVDLKKFRVIINKSGIEYVQFLGLTSYQLPAA